MASETTPTITFYDMASGPPLRTFAPNPWKTRYALNFKRVPYQTRWVDMPDITSVREELRVPANRTHPDGTPYHTLPVIHDAATGRKLGDTFEIAVYLDQTYPTNPPLFRPHTTGLTAALNAHIDGLFTRHILLCDQMPFEGHARQAEIQGIFLARVGAARWEDMQLPAAARADVLVQFERALGELAKAFRHVGGTTDYLIHAAGTAAAEAQKSAREDGGPFLDGDGAPAYADLIVGAWLAMFEASMRPEDWVKVCSWQDGCWGRLHKALEPWRTIV